MKVGDLVAAKLHTNNVMLGIISHVAQLAPVDEHGDIDFYVDSMYPYFVCFNDTSYNDWYQSSTLEIISEGR